MYLLHISYLCAIIQTRGDIMGLFNIFRKKTQLKTDIDLSEYFDSRYHSGDMYIASQHCVRKKSYIPLPGGGQGYRTINIPDKIKTEEQLFDFLIKEHYFIKSSVEPSMNINPILKIQPTLLKNPLYNLFNIIVDETSSLSVNISKEAGLLIAYHNNIAVNNNDLYGVTSEPIKLSYSNLHEFLQQAPNEIRSQYNNLTQENWREYVPKNSDEPRLCDCSLDKRHAFVSFGTHVNSCVGTPTNYVVHRCCKCGYIYQGFFISSEYGDVVKKIVTVI